MTPEQQRVYSGTLMMIVDMQTAAVMVDAMARTSRVVGRMAINILAGNGPQKVRARLRRMHDYRSNVRRRKRHRELARRARAK